MNLEQRFSNQSQILLRLPASLQTEDVERFCIVFCALLKLQKSVAIEGAPLHPDLFAPYTTPPKGKRIGITLKNIAPFVSRVYYDKTNQDLKFTVTLSEGTFQKEQVQLDVPRDQGLTITFGSATEKEHDVVVPAVEAMPVLMHGLSLPEQSLLYLAAKIFPTFEKIPGAALYISTASGEWFQKTETSPKTLTGVVNTFRECFAPQHSYIVLYQGDSPQNTQGLLFCLTPQIQERILRTFPGEAKEQWALFTIPNTQLPEAKKAIINTLSPLWQTP